MPAIRPPRQIYVKFGTDILNKNLSDKHEFRENRFGDTRALLKDVKELLLVGPIFLDGFR